MKGVKKNSMLKNIRKIKYILDCEKTFEGDGIPVTRAFPIAIRRENDPFLLFDHFGPISFKPGYGSGVPAHPHCGFEAITYLLQGEIEHQDSWGGQASIKTGDIQWMTTGSGLIHSELATEDFKKVGGIMEGLQIWVNLPRANKSAKPGYQHIDKKNIPFYEFENQVGKIIIIAGEIFGRKSIVNTYSPVSIFDIQLIKPGKINFTISKEQTLMLYVINGKIQFTEKNLLAQKGQMIYFDQNGDQVYFESISDNASYLVLAGKPLKEPISRHGPFVANTEAQIKQAIQDYNSGKMGNL